jgi:nucleotide-binding universal stress UspA family protein
MFQRILVIFENEKVYDQAITYSFELARRMDSEVTFLMLMEMEFPRHALLDSKRKAIQRLESRIGETLGHLSSEFLKEGVSVSAALRVGDAPQELLKFMAERPPFQAIIWGSSEDMPDAGLSKRSHWIWKIANSLECPLLAVSSRDKSEKAKDSK